MRGYFGIGVENMCKEPNYGTLFRSAYNFGAGFMFLIGKRFRRQCSDTTAAYRSIPLYEYQTSEDFLHHIPYGCIPICVEVTDKAVDLVSWVHPERAIYILGPEDGSVSKAIRDRCQAEIKIPSHHCLNVAVCGAILMYDRLAKSQQLESK